jgi:hypothetical protein
VEENRMWPNEKITTRTAWDSSESATWAHVLPVESVSVWAKSPSAIFDGHAIRVTVPARVMREWTETGRVGIEATSQSGVQLLIEKDYQCLHGLGGTA